MVLRDAKLPYINKSSTLIYLKIKKKKTSEDLKAQRRVKL